MMNNNPYAAYRTTQTVTASKTQLLVMLHDGAIRFLAQSAVAVKKKDYETKSINLNKAIAIVDHLWGTLDMERGGEIAENLERIFLYLRGRLLEFNVSDDLSIIKEVMQHLREIRSAWAIVDSQTKTVRTATANAPCEGEVMQFAA